MAEDFPPGDGGALIPGEIRYGDLGFFCATGRNHLIHDITTSRKISTVIMDIGPCSGHRCPFYATHGLSACNSHQVCVETRRVILDHWRKFRSSYTAFSPITQYGRKVAITCRMVLRDDSVEAIRYGFALAAEEIDGLTGGWPHNWQQKKCEASGGHEWQYADQTGRRLPSNSAGVMIRDCVNCPQIELKRFDGQWSNNPEDCPCCVEMPVEHATAICRTCRHGPANLFDVMP